MSEAPLDPVAPADVVLRRERWETPDGDFLDLDFADAAGGNGRALPADAPHVLLLPGIDGSARSDYVHRAYRRLVEAGMRPVGLNFRSCSGEPNRRGRFFHAGDVEDPGFALRRLIERRPGAAVGVLGFSLGGNMILRYLGLNGADCPSELRAVVAVSPPIDLRGASRKLGVGEGLLFAQHVLRTLKPRIKAKAETLDPATWGTGCGGRAPDMRRTLKARSMREFDDALIAPVHGFRDVDDYHRRASSASLLDRIERPTLIVRADEDPFLGDEDLRHPALQGNPSLSTFVTSEPGHVGFLAWTDDDPRNDWASVAVGFLNGHLHAR